MIEPIRRLLHRRFKRLPSALCFFAIAMQVGLPILHGPHFASMRVPVAAACDAAAISSSAPHADGESAHDSSSCPQCRLASQLRSLAPLSVVASVPEISADWLACDASTVPVSHTERDSGAPRAPPILA